MNIALRALRLGEVPKPPLGPFWIKANQFSLTIIVPADHILENFAHSEGIDSFEVDFRDDSDWKEPRVVVEGAKPLVLGLITPLFVDFYEGSRACITSHYGERDNWPELFRFCWAIRNACAHHGGKLNITDPNIRAVQWHHLRYDHRDAGLQVIGGHLDLGDLVILMVELSDELDRLDCPISA